MRIQKLSVAVSVACAIGLSLLGSIAAAHAGDLCPQPPDPPLFCPPPNPCLDFGACDPETGQCAYPPMPDGSFCNDNNNCTTGESCQAGVCSGGTATNNPCDDGNLCTANDACVGTTCTGTSYTCNDSNPCTDDACLPEEGCTWTPNTASCNDNDMCTTVDQCSGGSCVGTSPMDCDDGNPCTTDECYAGFGCAHFGNPGQACNDGSACTGSDVCAGQNGTTCAGTTVDCDDSNGCTADSCDPESGCENLPQPHAPCSDGNACTAPDACDAAGTTCISGSAVVCTALDVCHVAGTCEPLTGCSNPPITDGTSCSDADACNGDETCQAGACRSSFGPSCDDDNPCTVDTCDAQSGCANTTAPPGTTCDDLDNCDGLEVCQADVCVPGTALDCSDPNPCTDDLCFPIKRESRDFVEETASVETTEMFTSAVTPAGGLMIYVVSHRENRFDNVHQMMVSVLVRVLRMAVDPERIESIVESGSPRAIAPQESIEITRDNPFGPGPALDFDFRVPAAAADIGNGRTRVVVPYSFGEGGCTFINQLGGPECVPGSGGTADLNGDSDPFDGMVAYAVIEIDRPTKTILSVQNVVTDTEGYGFLMATDGHKIVHFNPEVGDAQCLDGGGILYCYGLGNRVDRNGDGMYSLVLGLHDVGTDQTSLSLLKAGSANSDLVDHEAPKMGGGLLAFESWERNPAPDYNNDGDFFDRAIRYVNVDELFARPTLTPSTGPVSSGGGGQFGLTGAEGKLITYLDYHLRLYDTVTHGDVNTDSPENGGNPFQTQLVGGIHALSTVEGPEQRPDVPSTDYNADGDYHDNQLRFYEHATRTIVTTNVTMDDAGPSSSDEHRQPASTDGEIIAYIHSVVPYTNPDEFEVRFIRVAPCDGVPCDEAEHCVNADAFNYTPCPDGDACNGNETCQSGVCTSGTPVTCNDQNQCTTDSCAEGLCSFAPRIGTCDDGNDCTASDACNVGFCQGSPITPPDEVQNLRGTNKVTFTWNPTTFATTYDAVRGSLSALPVGPGGGDEMCLAGQPGPTLTDNSMPSSGTGVWYLVRGENSCGIGTWGTRSNGFPQQTTTCP